EHGLDARHALLPVARPGPSQLSPQQPDLWPALRLPRKLHPAAEPRRGRARQAVADWPDAGRPLAALCQFTRLLRLYVDPPGQEAVVYGRRIRPGGRVEP